MGTIVGIWAHPDDEAYLSGGLMAIARRSGQRVVCVTATRGELGTSDPAAWPPDQLALARTQELADCLGILGVTEHHWLSYRDGRCADVPDSEAVGRLRSIIDEVRPDTVLTFGPDGITGHPDHQAVGAWALAAVDQAGAPMPRLLQAAVPEHRAKAWEELNESLGVFSPGYPVIAPVDRIAVDLTLEPDIAARKVQALQAQVTQTASLIATLGRERYTAWVSEESFAEATRDGGTGEARQPPSAG